MNTKVANVIAIELAILIAVLVWLGASRVPSVQPQAAADARARDDNSLTTVTPAAKPKSRNLLATNDDADRESFAQAPEDQPQTTPEYVQELVTEPYPSSDHVKDFVAENEPSYAAIDQAPTISSPDYYVAPVEQIVEFVQPSQIIVFSNTRPCGHPRRCPTRSWDPPVTAQPQCPNGGRLPVRGGVMAPPRIVSGGVVSPRKVGGGMAPRQNTNVGLVPRQNPNGGLVPRQNVSARVVPQNQGLKARWDP